MHHHLDPSMRRNHYTYSSHKTYTSEARLGDGEHPSQIAPFPASDDGGLHGMPSIFLLKQWLCTQLIQGLKTATQRDLNIKRRTIWATLQAPNDDHCFANACCVSLISIVWRNISTRWCFHATAVILSVPKRKGSIKISQTGLSGLLSVDGGSQVATCHSFHLLLLLSRPV